VGHVVTGSRCADHVELVGHASLRGDRERSAGPGRVARDELVHALGGDQVGDRVDPFVEAVEDAEEPAVVAVR